MKTTFARKAMDKSVDMAGKSMKQMDKMAAPVERAAERISPSLYVAVGLECCVASTVLTLAGKHRWASMVNSWATCSLLLGIYSKLQREHGK